MKFLAIIFDGFEEEEATASFALLRRAKQDLVIASDKSIVTGAYNLTYSGISILNTIDYKNFDCLILPGGPHYKTLKTNSLVLEIINYFISNNKYVAAICASPTILGGLGYLKNKNYTCFTSMNNDFGGSYIDQKVVVDGNIITARSVDASIDFAYTIISVVCGQDILDEVYARVYHEE